MGATDGRAESMNRLPTLDHFRRVVDRIQRHELNNGLTLLLYSDPSVPIVTSMLWYRVGTRFEPLGSTGISHFLEHMMFKGSRGYAKGEIDLITTLNGGTNNAYTSSDYTAYYFSFASDRWQQALEIEADRMQYLLLDPGEFELEREVILEEMRMERDDPWYRLRERVEESSLGNHPYHFPIIGYRGDVESLTLEALKDHYRHYYTPSNAVLVLAGDLEPESARDRVTELMSAIPAGTRIAEVQGSRPPVPTRRRIEMTAPGRVGRVLVTFPAPAICHSDHYAFHLLDQILVEGKLSCLHRRLVEEVPVAAYVTGDFADTAEPYLYFLRLELLPGVRAEIAEQVLLEELERVRGGGISREELERAKNHVVFATVASFETSFDLAAQVGLTELLGQADYWPDYLEKIEALSLRDVQKVAGRYLDPQSLVLGVSTRAE